MSGIDGSLPQHPHDLPHLGRLERSGGSELNCVGFDGKMKWKRAIGAGVSPSYGDDGGFDVADDGTLHAISPCDNVIREYDSDGQPSGQVKLSMPAQPIAIPARRKRQRRRPLMWPPSGGRSKPARGTTCSIASPGIG
jgi:hypothetical protein